MSEALVRRAESGLAPAEADDQRARIERQVGRRPTQVGAGSDHLRATVRAPQKPFPR